MLSRELLNSEKSPWHLRPLEQLCYWKDVPYNAWAQTARIVQNSFKPWLYDDFILVEDILNLDSCLSLDLCPENERCWIHSEEDPAIHFQLQKVQKQHDAKCKVLWNVKFWTSSLSHLQNSRKSNSSLQKKKEICEIRKSEHHSKKDAWKASTTTMKKHLRECRAQYISSHPCLLHSYFFPQPPTAAHHLRLWALRSKSAQKCCSPIPICQNLMTTHTTGYEPPNCFDTSTGYGEKHFGNYGLRKI